MKRKKLKCLLRRHDFIYTKILKTIRKCKVSGYKMNIQKYVAEICWKMVDWRH